MNLHKRMNLQVERKRVKKKTRNKAEIVTENDLGYE